MTARLFHVPLSPFCRKVRLSLGEKKIEVELVEERYWEQDPDFLRRNPAGKVPVLRLDGIMMAESAAICEYIEETRPEASLLPSDPVQRLEVRRLVSWFDDKFHDEVTSKLLYERVNKKVTKQGYPDSKNVKAGAKAIKYHLDYMAWLLDHRRWLAGDVMTLADFAIGTGQTWLRTGTPRSNRVPPFGRSSPTNCRASRRRCITTTSTSDACPPPRRDRAGGPQGAGGGSGT